MNSRATRTVTFQSAAIALIATAGLVAVGALFVDLRRPTPTFTGPTRSFRPSVVREPRVDEPPMPAVAPVDSGEACAAPPSAPPPGEPTAPHERPIDLESLVCELQGAAPASFPACAAAALDDLHAGIARREGREWVLAALERGGWVPAVRRLLLDALIASADPDAAAAVTRRAGSRSYGTDERVEAIDALASAQRPSDEALGVLESILYEGEEPARRAALALGHLSNSAIPPEERERIVGVLELMVGARADLDSTLWEGLALAGREQASLRGAQDPDAERRMQAIQALAYASSSSAEAALASAAQMDPMAQVRGFAERLLAERQATPPSVLEADSGEGSGSESPAGRAGVR